MRNANGLKKTTEVLILVLAINIGLKLFGRIVLSKLTHWLLMCSGNECTGLMWWQRLPQLEKAVWLLIDYLETTNQ